MTPRRRLILTGAGCLVAGAALGWHLRPVPMEERASEAVEARTVEVFTGAEEWVTRRAATEEAHQVITRDDGGRTRYHPNGAVAEVVHPSRTVTETGTKKTETKEGAGNLSATLSATSETVANRTTERTIPTQPDWLLSAQVAAGSTGIMYGGQVSRRVLGPLWLQAGAMAGGGEWVGVVGLGIGW